MNQFFDYNNNVFRILGGLADCLILGALWIVCSIPVVTMGAATAAVYHAVNKSIVHGQGYAFREYCTALKTDLKQTTGAWLLWGILAAFLAADLVVTRQFLAQGSALGALYYFFIVLSAMALAWEFYLTAYMARFEGTIRESMKKTLVMVVANLGWSALLVAVFVLFVLMCNDTQCLIVLFPGVFALVKNYVLEKVFRKYRTPEDLVCTEGKLSGLTLLDVAGIRLVPSEELYTEEPPKEEAVTLRAIPYFAWGNRGLNQMRVWMHEK